MTDESVFEKVGELKIIPVLAVEETEKALPLVEALSKGGLPLAEVAFRTDAAAEAMRAIRENFPDMLLGAGTVLTPEQARLAKQSGADFAVAPGMNPDVVRAAMAAGLPLAPGIMTPTDLDAALRLDMRVIKYFPAEAAGGLKLIKSIAAPFRHLGVKFIPTGGINEDNLKSYLSDDIVLAVGGTWLAKKDDISEGRWDQIVERCRRAVGIVKG